MAQSSACKECGWSCKNCLEHGNLHLHVEIENLKQKLLEREHHIVTMETNFLSEADKFPNGEFAALTEELLTWQEKYSRLYESHKRVQKVNQNLEDKLLKIVDKCETEKSALTRDVANLSQKLVDTEEKVSQLKEENERYRNDVNLAIQLLQCKPANFVSQKYDTLPADLQQKVRLYVSSKRRPSDANGTQNKPELKTIKVPIPTFPPTAMVYSINKDLSEKEVEVEKPERRPVDIVSAAIMAKVLEERERERLRTKHCASCTCPRQPGPCKATQTHEPPSQRSQGLIRYVNVVASRGDTGRSMGTGDACDKLQRNRAKPSDIPPEADDTGDSLAPRNGDDTSKVHAPRKSDLEVCMKKLSAKEGSVRKGAWVRQGNEVLTTVLRGREKGTGPRPCSMRLQAGTSNILLDNATSYAPVLYTGRHTSPSRTNSSGSSSAVLVHCPRSRSDSSSSSSDSSSPRPSPTETQI